MNPAWNIGSLIGGLALMLWWHDHGAAFLLRRKARLFGTCKGCGREKPSCSCQSFTFKPEWEDDDVE